MTYAEWSSGAGSPVRRLRPASRLLAVSSAVLLGSVALVACSPDRARIKPVAPSVPVGACCSTQGTCTLLAAANCTALGSAYQYRGDGTVCTPNPCSLPTDNGACCSAQAICSVMSGSACTAQGAGYQYLGDNTVCTPNPCTPELPPADYVATGLVSSYEAKEITTVSGAGLKVPLLSVPLKGDGSEGKMAFSIERDQTLTVTPPTGHSKTSDLYRFGPDGFVFARPLELKIPVLGDTTGKVFSLYRVNETTGQSEPYGGAYDRVTKTISVQTFKLSPWFIASAPQANTAWGAIEVTNSSSDKWLNLCIEEYALKYPAADADFHGEASSSWAPVGEIGVTNHGLWYVPQGTYRICADMRTAGTISSPPGAPRHMVLENIQVNSPWTYTQPVTTPLTLSSLSSDAPDGACSCIPVPTPSVGTGQVQVTLTWHSAQPVDLDLWVTEPDSEVCFYGHTPTSSGGSLDLDNQCLNYVDGRPENIFWDTAPTGPYKVQVDWYGDCGTGVTSLGYDVRVINAGTVRTFSGTINADARVDVATFTVLAGAPVRFGPPGGSSVLHGSRPEKKW